MRLITKINACTNEGARSSHNIKKKLFCVTKVFLFLGELIPNVKNEKANFQRYCGSILVCTCCVDHDGTELIVIISSSSSQNSLLQWMLQLIMSALDVKYIREQDYRTLPYLQQVNQSESKNVQITKTSYRGNPIRKEECILFNSHPCL